MPRDNKPYLWKDSLINGGKQRRRVIGEFIFYFKEDSVVMEYKRTYTLYHAFNQKYKPRFRAFAKRIYRSTSMDIYRMYELASKYNVMTEAVSASAIADTIEFEKTPLTITKDLKRIAKGDRRYDVKERTA